MNCPECKTGIISRSRKPDALERIVVKCDACDYRRFIPKPGAPDVVVPLSGSLVTTRSSEKHVTSRAAAPVIERVVVSATLEPPVVGKPCQHCGQKVKPRRMCIQCRTRPCPPHKRRCTICKPPTKRLPSRYCVECGVLYERQVGDPPSAAYRCPTHRKEKAIA